MAQAVGGKVVRAAKVMHGKTSPITHNGVGVFKGLANPLTVTRYHSLVVEDADIDEGMHRFAHAGAKVIGA